MRLFLAAVLTGLLLLGAGPVRAQAPGGETPPAVQEFVKLLNDPAVRTWIERQGAAPRGNPDEIESNLSLALGARVAAVRDHLAEAVATLPRLPEEFARGAAVLKRDLGERSLFAVVLLLAAFVALGLGCQQLFVRAMSGPLARITQVSFDTVAQRVRAIGLRLAFGLGVVASQALGLAGAFLLFDWPPMLREILLALVASFLGQRVIFAGSMITLSPLPSIERFRIIPMDMAAARFWHRRVTTLAAWFAAGGFVLTSARLLGFSAMAELLLAYVFDLGILALMLEMSIHRPAPTLARPGMTRTLKTALLVGFFVLLYALRVTNAMGAFWLILVAGALPAAIGVLERSVNHILRPPGADDAASALPNVHIVAFERGLRTAMIIAVAYLLGRAWGLDAAALTESDSGFTRLVRGALTAVVILLVADFVWQVIKTWIDRRLALAAPGGEHADSEMTSRQARLRTLLPILRNMLLVVLASFAVMMALSALGVEIGPLIAGAGVVGVALGFGAQTLVRDVLSGIFYLLDDAFRIGEYIQAGNYKGTVESFSLRSIKLRHHRGPLYTVPFGALGAVQNMSRDWVIDKFSVGVTYDTNLETVKKLVKQIGKELSQDAELAPHIIEPLKMQGVEQFGDFAIQVRMKIMTKPGEQFVIRRRAFALIKKAFDANGVRFAFPTVQIAGGEDAPGAGAAVARQALELVKPAAP